MLPASMTLAFFDAILKNHQDSTPTRLVVCSVRHYDFGVRKECPRPAILAAGKLGRHSGGEWRLYSARIAGAVLVLSAE